LWQFGILHTPSSLFRRKNKLSFLYVDNTKNTIFRGANQFGTLVAIAGSNQT
jgi:hypothetical protein